MSKQSDRGSGPGGEGPEESPAGAGPELAEAEQNYPDWPPPLPDSGAGAPGDVYVTGWDEIRADPPGAQRGDVPATPWNVEPAQPAEPGEPAEAVEPAEPGEPVEPFEGGDGTPLPEVEPADWSGSDPAGPAGYWQDAPGPPHGPQDQGSQHDYGGPQTYEYPGGPQMDEAAATAGPQPTRQPPGASRPEGGGTYAHPQGPGYGYPHQFPPGYQRVHPGGYGYPGVPGIFHPYQGGLGGYGYVGMLGSYANPAHPDTNERASEPASGGWALGLAVCSYVLVFACGLGFFTAILALVLAHQARGSARRSGGAQASGMATAAIVLSWVLLALVVLVVVLGVALVASYGLPVDVPLAGTAAHPVGGVGGL